MWYLSIRWWLNNLNNYKIYYLINEWHIIIKFLILLIKKFTQHTNSPISHWSFDIKFDGCIYFSKFVIEMSTDNENCDGGKMSWQVAASRVRWLLNKWASKLIGFYNNTVIVPPRPDPTRKDTMGSPWLQ